MKLLVNLSLLVASVLIMSMQLTPAIAQDNPAGQQDLSPAAGAEDTPDNSSNPDDPVGDLIEAVNTDDNGITINREERYVDLASTVCMREGDFLEMFACAKDSREHESILVIDARPSAVHMSLLLMGVEPGSPMTWEETEDAVLTIEPRGPEIEVFVIVETRGEAVMRPANEWVMDQKTEEVMEGNAWLFTGSDFTQMNGREVYRADAYGTAISLVSFGDDMMARANEMTDDNTSHGNVWGARTDQIPDVGTAVTIRLQLPEADSEAENGESDAESEPNESEPGGP